MLFVAIVNICILVLFFLLGLLFARGKGAGLIAGYNTMSAREKEKYDKLKVDFDNYKAEIEKIHMWIT